MRLSQVHSSDERLFRQFTALSVSMMRQSCSARSLLLRVQARREKREADPGALNQANWIEHCAIGLMADALGRAGPAAIEQPAPPPPAAVEEAEPQPDLAAEADQYALIHPRRAALIRRLGGLPEKCTFGPPSAELVEAIVSGSSSILCALDGAAEAAAVPALRRVQHKGRQAIVIASSRPAWADPRWMKPLGTILRTSCRRRSASTSVS